MRDLIIQNKPTLLLLGSNINPRNHIKLAIQEITDIYHHSKISHVYRSKAVDIDPVSSQPDYLNVAIEIIPDTTYLSLFNDLRQIETKLGRERSENKYAARTIDIDIVWIEGINTIINGKQIPDPEILMFPHIYYPIKEINPRCLADVKRQFNSHIMDFIVSNEIKDLGQYSDL